MEELPPYIQQLLFKVQEAFEEEASPLNIHITKEEIQVETSKQDYKLKTRRKRPYQREPLGEYIHRHLAKYTKDLLDAEPLAFIIPKEDGTIEHKLRYYLNQEELAQTRKDNSMSLEAFAKIGEIIQPYHQRPKDLKSIKKVIKEKGRHPVEVIKVAKRTWELTQKRGHNFMRNFQRITPWIIYRMNHQDWKELVELAAMMKSIDAVDSQELIFEGPEMLQDDFGTPDPESLDHQ